MAQSGAHVRDGVLTVRDGERHDALPVGSGAWADWLEQPGSTGFRFEGGAGPFTARRETQRGRWYWYAYRRQGGRLRKAYLGRSRDLTLDRLMGVAARLAAPLDGPAAPVDGDAATSRSAPGGERHNLLAQVSSFLGREADMAEVRRVLGTTRLVTLAGSGGVGKTRLALRAAAALLDDTADAAWLVELAPLADASLVPPAVARAIGLRDEPGRPLLAALAAGLGHGRVLLVLDNCEHLVDGCALLAEHLLRACPDLRILATSRQPLGVPGEVVWRVPSLDLPPAGVDVTPEQMARCAAVQLFVERAQAAQPGFTLTEHGTPVVAEVCRQLDGIPLAIEIAAARVRALTPQEIAARLGDRFRLLADGSRTAHPRQQTLRAAVDWSYDLLAPGARRLFERLAVFAGGFTLEAAEVVCAGDGIEPATVLDLLVRLVDRSLVHVEPRDETEPTRYRLLEPLRAYGLERLGEGGEADRFRARHATWIMDLAQQAERALRGPEQGFWLRWAEREQDNARAALAWALEQADTETATRLAAALSWPWLVHQRWSEGFDWARRVLALPHGAPTRERGMLLTGAIQLALFRGDLASNRPSGDPGAVRMWLEECLAIGEALPDAELVLAAHGIIDLIRELGVPLTGLPETGIEETQALARRIGHAWGQCRGFEALARRALRAGDLDAAHAALAEAAGLARSAGDTYGLAMVLNQLGDVERARGGYLRARARYEESRGLFADLGLVPQPYLLHNLGYVALAAGDRVGAAAHFAQALTRYRRLGEERGMAECLLGFGAVAAAAGRPADAARLFGAGEAALAALGAQLWHSNRPDYERWLARARTRRTAAEFDRARAEGRALSLEEATLLALERGATARSVRPPDAAARLTPREREVARCAARGLTNREIADALTITEKTAANHVQRVLDKLELRSRTQLAARAVELGLGPAGAADAHP